MRLHLAETRQRHVNIQCTKETNQRENKDLEIRCLECCAFMPYFIASPLPYLPKSLQEIVTRFHFKIYRLSVFSKIHSYLNCSSSRILSFVHLSLILLSICWTYFNCSVSTLGITEQKKEKRRILWTFSLYLICKPQYRSFYKPFSEVI